MNRIVELSLGERSAKDSAVEDSKLQWELDP